MLTLETERLILRNFIEEDWEALNAIMIDPEVKRYSYFATWDEAERREWFAWLVQDAHDQNRDAYNWAITLKRDGMLIGWFGIGSASNPMEEGDRSCGYALNRQFWGQGYMPEAMRAVYAYEFGTLGTQLITATCDVRNPASARVMEKCGMTYQATFEDDDGQGIRANRHHYAIRKQNFAAFH